MKYDFGKLRNADKRIAVIQDKLYENKQKMQRVKEIENEVEKCECEKNILENKLKEVEARQKEVKGNIQSCVDKIIELSNGANNAI